MVQGGLTLFACLTWESIGHAEITVALQQAWAVVGVSGNPAHALPPRHQPLVMSFLSRAQCLAAP